MVSRIIRIISLTLSMLLAVCCMTGCFGKMIVQDEEHAELPDVDPEDGVEKTVAVKLYYRLTNAEYLAGVESSVTVRAGERTETAVIRALIEGVPPLASNVSALFPSGTSIENTYYEKGILYVTLSKEVLDDSIIASLKEEDYQNPEDYQQAVDEATREMYLRRRLGVLSIVNTIAGSDEGSRVQIMVDNEGSGTGSRMPYETFGFEKRQGEIMEPMGFDESVVVTPEKVVGCLFERIANGQYDMAYALVAESDYYGITKPAYADFEAEMEALGRLESYEITGTAEDGDGIYVMVDVRIAAPGGTMRNIIKARIYLEREGDLYKVCYSSLQALMES